MLLSEPLIAVFVDSSTASPSAKNVVTPGIVRNEPSLRCTETMDGGPPRFATSAKTTSASPVFVFCATPPAIGKLIALSAGARLRAGPNVFCPMLLVNTRYVDASLPANTAVSSVV